MVLKMLLERLTGKRIDLHDFAGESTAAVSQVEMTASGFMAIHGELETRAGQQAAFELEISSEFNLEQVQVSELELASQSEGS
ncbi:hypothetical protein [Dongshaea marina]|uniref:hypothetical protein n=1 Tax=Dongshaea marina TaxID=2047966 RepID=UPI000D3E5E24|nr:hypothetical protein [Dongshaea marina]